VMGGGAAWINTNYRLPQYRHAPVIATLDSFICH